MPRVPENQWIEEKESVFPKRGEKGSVMMSKKISKVGKRAVQSIVAALIWPFGKTKSHRVPKTQGQKTIQASWRKLRPPVKDGSPVAEETESITSNDSSFFESKFRASSLEVLELRGAEIQALPGEMKKLTNLKVLDLTNCGKLRNVEPGIISSLVRLEELYMLGSFSGWEVEDEGKIKENASINELEVLPALTRLQIQIQDASVIPESSHLWSRLSEYVILAPGELKCRYQGSSHVSWPTEFLDDDSWQFQGAMHLDLPSLTSFEDWMHVTLNCANHLCLEGDGSKNAVDALIPDGFKLLKQLKIGHCMTMEYLVDGVDQKVPANGFFPSLESLCLEDLPLFKEVSISQLPVGLFGELRSLQLYNLPALLHVCQSRTPGLSFSNLRSVHISRCPTLRGLFSLSTARNMMQLEEIKIENCEMMEEIFAEENGEDGIINKKIEFSKLNHLELDNLPHLTDFCKHVRFEFPQLTEMCIRSLAEIRTLCPTECDLSFEGNDSNDVQCLFDEKVGFGSLRKLNITELNSVAGIWSHQTSSSLFSELEELVVASCGTLRKLFTYSIAKALVQLRHLTVEDCFMMQEVIVEDGETGQSEINETLFPQLKKMELQRLPILERFCHMMNGLELPSLEDLTFNDCPGMKEFCGGKLSMPVLRCVRRDSLIYKIDGSNYSTDRLFNDKHLFVHQSWPLPSQYQGAELEEFVEEEGMKEFTRSHLACSSQASGDDKGVNLRFDMNEKSICSTSNQNTMTEQKVSGPPDSYWGELREERGDEDVSVSHFLGTQANRGQIEKISDAKLEVPIDMESHSQHWENFILFCSIFPADYEFTKDILVWQWIAGGLIKLEKDETMEEVCVTFFDTLLSMDYIVASSYDNFVDQMKYKIGDEMTTFLQEKPFEPKFRKNLDGRLNDTVEVEHLSLACEEIDSVKFGVLKQCSCLQTLIIHRCYGFEGNYLPSDLFSELKALKILNLSHTNIVELPSSVEILEELQYLDMSGTPIGWLPETMCCFRNLHTLKLDGCLSLRGLPKCTSKLINLRHLLLDVVRQLQSMPIGIGKLSKLRTLSAFLVGEDDGCGIGELKDMNELRGSFRILNLENVKTKEEAAEACLRNKQDLTKIELQWSVPQHEKNPQEEEILESLQPPLGIQELKIFFYSGGVLPSWISDRSFSELGEILLYKCRFCSGLPSLGELPSLKHLSIVENNEVMEIGSSFCRKQTDQGDVAFPKLERLLFDSMSKLEKWTDLEKGDFPSLRYLTIMYCPKFVGLPSLSHMNSLLLVETNDCPELSCLPEDGLPSTLESLIIKDCPKLKDSCCNEQGADWLKVARVPFLYIDDQKVSPQL